MDREPVLDGIFFFDEEDRKKNPILEYSIAELASKIWMRSYSKFEEELYKIIKYFNSRCDDLGCGLDLPQTRAAHQKL